MGKIFLLILSFILSINYIVNSTYSLKKDFSCAMNIDKLNYYKSDCSSFN